MLVKFKWQLEDGSWVTAPDKMTSVRVGAEKLVFFSVDSGYDVTSAFQGHPGYMDSSNCKTNALIT